MRDEPVYRLPPDVRMVLSAVSLTETIDWSQKFLGIPELWKETAGEGIRVAVLDTGVDYNHPDLQGAIADAVDCTRSRTGPKDVNGHGTWCVGCIGSRANEIGTRGIAYKCQMYSAKVLGDNGAGDDRTIALGLEWAIGKDVDVISMSLGGPEMGPRVRELLKEFTRKPGKFIFAAAGNDGGRVNAPAKYRETIAVGAVDKRGRMTNFTSRGEELDILAPGFEMLGPTPGATYSAMTGSSMSAPTAGGVGALALAKHKAIGGKTDLETTEQMREHLKRTAKATPDGYGLIDPAKLLAEHKAEAPKPAPVASQEVGGIAGYLASFVGLKVYSPARAGDAYSLGK